MPLPKIMFRCLLLAVWFAIYCVPIAQAQNPENIRVVKLSLTHPDLVMGIGPECFASAAYTFQPLNFRSPYVVQAFKAFKRGKLKFYKASDFQQAYTYREVADALPFLEAYLSTKYQRGDDTQAEVEAWPKIEVALWSAEIWQYDSTNIIIESVDAVAGILALKHQAGHTVQLFFQWEDPRQPLDLLGINPGYGGIGQLDVRGIVRTPAYTFRMMEWFGPEDVTWKVHIHRYRRYVPLRLPSGMNFTIPNCHFQIPFDTANIPDAGRLMAAQALHFEWNDALRSEAAPVLARALLMGKLKGYYFNRWERIPVAQLRTLANVTPADLTPDYDFGPQMAGLTVGGTYHYDTLTRTTRFAPEYLGIVWRNANDPINPEVQLARVRIADVARLGIKVLNTPLEQVLVQHKAFHYLFQMQTAFPANHSQAAWVNYHLRVGLWAPLMVPPTEEQMTLEYVEQMAAPDR